MKIKLMILGMVLAATANACLPPLKPLPPLGCTYDDAILIYQGDNCHWVYINCN